MMTTLPIRTLIISPLFRVARHRNGGVRSGLLQVLGNPSEWKWAATVAIVLFVASLALAPALIRDQQKLASEINTKTLKAAAALKNAEKRNFTLNSEAVSRP